MRWSMVFITFIISVVCHATTVYQSQNEQGQTLYSDQPSANATLLTLKSSPYRYRVKLKRVIDGDTIELQSGQIIRLLGINTPEIQSRYHDAEAGGEQSKQWLINTLSHGDFFIEYDQQQRDKYDRALAHCFLPDGQYLNAMLIEEGLASLTLIPPNLRYSDKLIEAQSRAEQAKKGIWSMSDYQVKHVSDLKTGVSYRGWQRIRLKLKAIKQGKNTIFLQANKQFKLAIKKKDSVYFEDWKHYLNRTVEVRGWVHRQGKQFYMNVRHPSAIITP
ncbi:MAG: nuclease [Methylophaga sp.]|uniref:thermonuclease family protein n=1 Tax=Methylophaga sp. UBA678 TaxID=1946901 RepID=UPI000C616C2F|nr:thermonuclease family protein [Methylophaga sp. UBA678]MAX52414.1 nuclease [Methylophaga sp.]